MGNRSENNLSENNLQECVALIGSDFALVLSLVPEPASLASMAELAALAEGAVIASSRVWG